LYILYDSLILRPIRGICQQTPRPESRREQKISVFQWFSEKLVDGAVAAP